MSNLHSTPPKKTLSIPKALGWSLFVTLLIGGTGTLVAYIPNFKPTPILGLITVWSLSILIGIAGFSNARRPHWIANFVFSFSLTALFLAGAIHGLGPYLLGWHWLVLLIAAYLFVWALPLLNPRLAKALGDEQMNPRTRLGKHQFAVALLIAIFGAVLIGIFTREQTGPAKPLMLFTGTMFSLLAIGGGQYFADQVRREWERQTNSQS